MLIIPKETQTGYAEFLAHKNVPQQYINKCQKWLRYYLDFCKKYHYEKADVPGLEAFLLKLTEKKQSAGSKLEAKRAIKLYWDFLLSKKNDPYSLKTQAKDNREPGAPKSHSKKNNARTAALVRAPASLKNRKNNRERSSWDTQLTSFKNAIRMRHYSDNTFKSYRKHIKDFQRYTNSLNPEYLTTEHVKNYLTHLAVKKRVSASTQNLAFNSLLFFYKNALNKEFGVVDGVVRAKKRPYIPVVLSRSEIDKIFKFIDKPYLLIVKLLYGCGLRLLECLSLRVNSLNIEEGVLTIHDGKGQKDRTVPLPKSLRKDIDKQLETVAALHKKDIARKYDGVFLFDAYERKSKNAARQFIWQWLFPAHKLTKQKETGKIKRYHLHETHVQKAIRRAVEKACLTKKVTAHTFRHSFASHLLQENYDIRTIQELLGHSDVRTTMIYTHTVQSRTKKEAKSPLDF